jgi:hypothetical protein
VVWGKVAVLRGVSSGGSVGNGVLTHLEPYFVHISSRKWNFAIVDTSLDSLH